MVSLPPQMASHDSSIDGMVVSEALEYSPEKCTVVATYKQLVVGAAFLSSPQETYITYLAVRAGWDNSQIATSVQPIITVLRQYANGHTI